MTMLVTTVPKQYELPDEGEHVAVVADLLDLGIVETANGPKHRVRFIFVIQQLNSEGKHIRVASSYNWTLHEKASLRKASTSILGHDPGLTLDLETLLGKNVRLVIEHKTREDRVYANIVAILRPVKGAVAFPIPKDFVRAQNKNADGSATNAKAPNSHGVDVTDDDVEFPGDADESEPPTTKKPK